MLETPRRGFGSRLTMLAGIFHPTFWCLVYLPDGFCCCYQLFLNFDALLVHQQASRTTGMTWVTPSTPTIACWTPRPTSAGRSLQPTPTETTGAPWRCRLSSSSLSFWVGFWSFRSFLQRTVIPKWRFWRRGIHIHWDGCQNRDGKAVLHRRDFKTLLVFKPDRSQWPQMHRQHIALLQKCDWESFGGLCPLQASVKPRCGRMVGFSSGGENPHGVKAVTNGQRCAVALWFTLDPLFRELVRSALFRKKIETRKCFCFFLG